jgi:hypothetical protein
MISFDALISVFVTSLVGSLHCIGMCGGFVALYSIGQRSSNDSHSTCTRKQLSPKEHWVRHLCYNLGRLAVYVFLGALAGFLGEMVEPSLLKSLQLPLATIAGSLIAIWGLALIAIALGAKPPTVLTRTIPDWLSKNTGHLYQKVTRTPGRSSALSLGLLSGLLPCGWLWIYIAAASTSGSALSGAILMGVFWLGTVPAMLSLGISVEKISLKWRQKLPALMGVMILILGVLTLSGRMTPHSHSHHTEPGHHHHH